MIKICGCGKMRTVQPFTDARTLKFTCLVCKDKAIRQPGDKAVVTVELKLLRPKISLLAQLNMKVR